MELKKIGGRTYLVVDDCKTKMIPKKYHDIPAIEIHLKMEDGKSVLNEVERFELNGLLCDVLIKKLLVKIKLSTPYVYELISKSKPKTALLVNVLNQGVRYELEFENKVCLRVRKEIYELFKRKKEIFKNY